MSSAYFTCPPSVDVESTTNGSRRNRQHRADFDRALAVVAEAFGPFDGGVDRPRLDQVVPAEDLLRLGERPVDDEALPPLDTHGLRLRARGERRAVDVGPRFLQVAG